MNFHEVTPEDGRWARPLLEGHGYKSCEYAFVNVYMWSRVYKTKIARYEDFVIARSEGTRLHYLYPAGKGNVTTAVDAILKDAEQAGKTPVIFSLDEEGKALLENTHPGQFLYEKPRAEADYIYLTSDLANLPGKKYQKKRNHCSRFERQYPDWSFHEITPDVIEDICEFNNRWCNFYDNRGDEGIAEERRAIQLVLSHYDELRLKGGYVVANGDIVAFSFGSPMGEDMFVTHVEKALYDVPGAYNIINREMARHFCGSYQYINRENDVGEDGLRMAKESYYPILLEEKYTAELI